MNRIDKLIIQNEKVDKLLYGKMLNFKNKSLFIKKDIENLNKELAEREKKNQLNVVSDKKIGDILNNSQKIVNLNVGGTIFTTSLNTLSSRRGTMFYKQILRGEFKKTDTTFYDREPVYFPIIMNFLRTGKANLNKLNNEAPTFTSKAVDGFLGIGVGVGVRVGVRVGVLVGGTGVGVRVGVGVGVTNRPNVFWSVRAKYAML